MSTLFSQGNLAHLRCARICHILQAIANRAALVCFKMQVNLITYLVFIVVRVNLREFLKFAMLLFNHA